MAIKIQAHGNGKRNGNGNGHGNGNGNGHANGNGHVSPLKLVVLALAVLLVAALAWRQYQRWRGPSRVVWVAASNLAPGMLVDADDLQQERRRAADLPQGAVEDRGEIEGQRLMLPKAEGEPFVSGDVAPPGNGPPAPTPGLAELMPEGRVLIEVAIAIENVIMAELRRGDRLDILSATESGARVVADDAYMLAFVDPNMLRRQAQARQQRSGGGEEERREGLLEQLLARSTAGQQRGAGPVMTRTTNMLLALKPEDVLRVTQAQAAGPLQIALHGQTEVRQGQLLSLDRSSWDVELINGSQRGSVEFVQ